VEAVSTTGFIQSGKFLMRLLEFSSSQSWLPLVCGGVFT